MVISNLLIILNKYVKLIINIEAELLNENWKRLLQNSKKSRVSK